MKPSLLYFQTLHVYVGLETDAKQIIPEVVELFQLIRSIYILAGNPRTSLSTPSSCNLTWLPLLLSVILCWGGQAFGFPWCTFLNLKGESPTTDRNTDRFFSVCMIPVADLRGGGGENASQFGENNYADRLEPPPSSALSRLESNPPPQKV